MLTYTKTIQETKNRLVIDYDQFTISPREDTNLGYFLTIDSKYHSPDKHEHIKNIMETTGHIAKDQKDHIKRMTDRINTETDEKVIKIYPIVKYEHGNVSYRLGSQHGFDYSNNGFYIITEKTQKEIGAKAKNFETIINSELDLYNKYINGEIFSMTLYDEDGELQNSCNSFYNIEDIREELPKEFEKENLEDYLAN